MPPNQKPPYPYDKRTDTIKLPSNIESEVRALLKSQGKPGAMKRVMELTGAGLKVSKDYVDSL
jgi:ribosomal protein L7/L12